MIILLQLYLLLCCQEPWLNSFSQSSTLVCQEYTSLQASLSSIIYERCTRYVALANTYGENGLAPPPLGKRHRCEFKPFGFSYDVHTCKHLKDFFLNTHTYTNKLGVQEQAIQGPELKLESQQLRSVSTLFRYTPPYMLPIGFSNIV